MLNNNYLNQFRGSNMEQHQPTAERPALADKVLKDMAFRESKGMESAKFWQLELNKALANGATQTAIGLCDKWKNHIAALKEREDAEQARLAQQQPKYKFGCV